MAPRTQLGACNMAVKMGMGMVFLGNGLERRMGNGNWWEGADPEEIRGERASQINSLMASQLVFLCSFLFRIVQFWLDRHDSHSSPPCFFFFFFFKLCGVLLRICSCLSSSPATEQRLNAEAASMYLYLWMRLLLRLPLVSYVSQSERPDHARPEQARPDQGTTDQRSSLPLERAIFLIHIPEIAEFQIPDPVGSGVSQQAHRVIDLEVMNL